MLAGTFTKVKVIKELTRLFLKASNYRGPG